MEGDSCSKHPNKMAIGFYSGSSFGLNGCEDCIKGYTKVRLYNLENSKKIWEENQNKQKENLKKYLEDGSKSVEVSTIRGYHWVLFGQDKIDYLTLKMNPNYTTKFKDERSYTYDSGD